jgi:uncharacterized protein YndB with AHSA1/START domain
MNTRVMSHRKKYQVEHQLRANPDLIFNYISTPSGLATWFADDVNVEGEIFTFIWNGSDEKARLVRKKQGKMVKFQWLGREDDEFLLIEIQQDELTRDVALIITDFEDEDEINRAKMVWDVSVDKLRKTIGG